MKDGDDFQRKIWAEWSSLGRLQSTIDPDDIKGLKNSYIDLTHKLCLSKEGRFLAKDKVLDFGCGVGRLSVWVADSGPHEVIGLDATPEMIDKARRQYPAKENLKFFSYDGSKIPFPNDYFDKILSICVLQHIVKREKFQAIIQELNRVLKPTGRILLIEQVTRQTTLQKYPRTDHNYKILRTRQEYIDPLQERGFRLVKHYTVNARGTGLFYKLIARNLFPAFLKPLIGLMARFDLWWAREKGIPQEGYVDCLFIFEKG
jgi:SAM-dependent methyltransferase